MDPPSRYALSATSLTSRASLSYRSMACGQAGSGDVNSRQACLTAPRHYSRFHRMDVVQPVAMQDRQQFLQSLLSWLDCVTEDSCASSRASFCIWC